MYELDLLPMDFNSIDVEPGDRVCLGPMRKFNFDNYVGFMLLYDGNVGPFEVVDIYPMSNATEISIGGERILISNDMIKKFCWN